MISLPKFESIFPLSLFLLLSIQWIRLPFVSAGYQPDNYFEEISIPNASQVDYERFVRVSTPKIKTDYMKEEVYLKKIFKEAGMSAVKAVGILNEIIAFREKQKLDTLNLNTSFDLIPKALPLELGVNFDKGGRPILFFPMGKWDMSKVVEGSKYDVFSQYLLHVYDRAANLTVKLQVEGRNISRYTFLIDTNDFDILSIRPSVATAMKDSCEHLGRYWPRMFTVYALLNANNALFSAAFKNVVGNSTEKYSYVEHDPAIWKPFLLTHVAPDQLPKGLGAPSSSSPIKAPTIPFNPFGG